MNWHDLCLNLKWKSFITSARLVSECVEAGQIGMINVDKYFFLRNQKISTSETEKGS